MLVAFLVWVLGSVVWGHGVLFKLNLPLAEISAAEKYKQPLVLLSTEDQYVNSGYTTPRDPDSHSKGRGNMHHSFCPVLRFTDAHFWRAHWASNGGLHTGFHGAQGLHDQGQVSGYH